MVLLFRTSGRRLRTLSIYTNGAFPGPYNCTNLALGIYKFELTVTDNAGATGKDTVTITINQATNQPPVANAGVDINITLPTNSVTLSGSGTDADGTITSYQWAKVSGPTQYTIASPNSAKTTVSNLSQGIYKFELTVTDNGGATAKSSMQVTVNAAPANQPPIANAGANINITLPANSTTLSGSGTDADGTVTSYQWTKISGPSQFTIVSPAAAKTTVNNLAQGIYKFQLTVTDNDGATGKDTATVTVNAAPISLRLLMPGPISILRFPLIVLHYRALVRTLMELLLRINGRRSQVRLNSRLFLQQLQKHR